MSRGLIVLSFLVSVAFVPFIEAGAIAPRWALLAIFIPWLVPEWKLTAGHLLIFCLLAWSAASVVWAADRYGAIQALIELVLFTGVFLVGSGQKTLRPVYIACGLGIGISSVVAIFQVIGWVGLPQFAAGGGLFFNPNFMAEAAVLILVALIIERVYWLIPFVLPAVLIPGARGCIVAFIVAMLAWKGNRLLIAATVSLAVLAGIFAVSTNYRMSSVTERVAIWRGTLDGLTPLGNGVGSFYLLYPKYGQRTDTLESRPDHAHNDPLEAIFELGIGAVFFFGFFGLALIGPAAVEKYVLLAFCVAGLFGFPLHNPFTAFIAALVAGRIYRDGPYLRDLVDWVRGNFCRRREIATLRLAANRRKSLPY